LITDHLIELILFNFTRIYYSQGTHIHYFTVYETWSVISQISEILAIMA